MASISNDQLVKFIHQYRESVEAVDVDAIERNSLTLQSIIIAEGGRAPEGPPERVRLFNELKSVHESACIVIARLRDMVQSEIDSVDSKDRVSAYVTTQLVTEGLQ